MDTHPQKRREKAERRRGPERRTRQVPVQVERRKGEDRRSGLERRLGFESATAGDQIHAAIGLLTYAVENAVMLDVDLWVLETAITRLHIALAKLDGEGGPSVTS
jgi:hypothetical protein